MRAILYSILIVLGAAVAAAAAPQWEKQGDYYYLTKEEPANFRATGAGENRFPGKYLSYEGVDFLVRAADDRRDYGRLDLDGNAMFSLPIRSGMKVQEVHFLAGGNFGNSYKHDPLLGLYGDNYYYATITVLFIYADGTVRNLAVPIFWDWFHLGAGEWSKDGARIKSVGNNPVRKDCSLYHISFLNPRPDVPLKEILVGDSWLGDVPFSDIFAVTIKSPDELEAPARTDRQFVVPPGTADTQAADTRTEWPLDVGLDGWVAGCSGNWDVHPAWQEDSFGRKGAAVIPACNVGGDKFSWIEKKIALPAWDRVLLRFARHSPGLSDLEKQWSDGELKVIIRSPAGQETVYDKLYGGEWSTETADLSRYKGRTVIVRFENHGGGQVKLSPTTSPACDGEDAVVADIRLIQDQQP